MLASESCAEAKFVTDRVGMPIALSTEGKKYQQGLISQLDHGIMQFKSFYWVSRHRHNIINWVNFKVSLLLLGQELLIV